MKKNGLVPKAGVQDSESFRGEAEVELGRLIAAARGFVGALPGSPRTAARVARVLGVQAKTGWQVFRLSTLEQPLAAVSFVPGGKPLRDAAERARGSGVSREIAEEFVAAYAGVEELVERTAGDWASFISMLGDLSRESAGTSDADRRNRAAAFKVYTHFSGMNADASVELCVTNEVTPGKWVEVSMRTLKGLRRFRADASCVVDEYRQFERKAREKEVALEPLDKEAFREHGVPVVVAFCSNPLPTLATTWDEKDVNTRYVEWASGAVGLSATVDMSLGVVVRRDVNPERDGRRHGVIHNTVVGYPVRRLEKTWLIRMPTREVMTPTLEGFLNRDALWSAHSASKSARMYGHERIERHEVGSWRSLPRGARLPREQIAYVCGTMGWNPAEFLIFTMEIDFPLVNSAIRVDLAWM